jgi:hypothetical protein
MYWKLWSDDRKYLEDAENSMMRSLIIYTVPSSNILD